MIDVLINNDMCVYIIDIESRVIRWFYSGRKSQLISELYIYIHMFMCRQQLHLNKKQNHTLQVTSIMLPIMHT